MAPSATWPADLTRVAARQVRRYRERAGMSAHALADALTQLGMQYTRTQVTNLESGRRDTITVGEVLAFAAVLDVAPALLLFPVGTDEEVPVLPHERTGPWTAYLYFVGDSGLTPGETGTGPADRDSPLWVYRQHDNALTGYVNARWNHLGAEDPNRARTAERHLTLLAAARIEMHRRGWAPPPVPSDVAEAMTEPLLEWGYRQDERGYLVEVGGARAGKPSEVER